MYYTGLIALTKQSQTVFFLCNVINRTRNNKPVKSLARSQLMERLHVNTEVTLHSILCLFTHKLLQIYQVSLHCALPLDFVLSLKVMKFKKTTGRNKFECTHLVDPWFWPLVSNLHAQWCTHSNASFGSLVNYRYNIQHFYCLPPFC